MRYAILLAAPLIVSALLPSVASAAPACKSNRAVATVDGMVCDFCAQGLIKTFKKNPDVSDVKIDLTSKKVTIDMKPGLEAISQKDVDKVIDYSGYKLVDYKSACQG